MRTRLRPRPCSAARVVHGALLTALAACASSPPATRAFEDPQAVTPIANVDGRTTVGLIRQTGSAVRAPDTPVAGSAAQAVAALPEVYEGFGLRVNTVVTEAGLVGVREVRAPRRLGKESLSRYVDCGTGATGAPHADTHVVTLTVISRVAPAGDSASAVATQVAASARASGTSGGTVRCSSSGQLEQAIHAALARRVGAR